MGSGQVNATSHTIAVQATVETGTGDNVTIVYERTEAGGMKIGDTEYPPPPPSWEEDGTGGTGIDDGFYTPPPPPPY